MNRSTRTYRATALLLGLLLCVGCGTHPSSMDRKGQSVTVRFLEREAAIAPPVWLKNPEDQANFSGAVAALELKNESKFQMGGFRTTETEAHPMIAAIPLLGLLAGAAIDYFAGSLASHAEDYRSSFQGISHADKFWTDPNQGTYQVRGFEITRRTKRDASMCEPPAFYYRAIIVPSADKRAFLIKPMCLWVQSTRAKIDPTSSEVAIKIEAAIDAMWIGKEQKINETRIATSAFDVLRPLEEPGTDCRLHTWVNPSGKVEEVAGWFPAVPVSLNNKDELVGLGTIRLVLNVIEEDTSAAPDRLISLSSALRDHKKDILKLLEE